LLAFSSLRKENPDFTAKIWNLDVSTQAILKQVESKYSSLLFAEKAIWTDKVEKEVSDFVASSNYDKELKSSLNTEEFEKTHLDYQEQAKLSKMYPKLIENIFSQIASKNENLNVSQLQQDYEQFLQTWEVKDNEKVLFEKIWNLLKKKFLDDINKNDKYIKNYKENAINTYIQNVFSFFSETLGLQWISKETSNKDTAKWLEKGFEIGENWKIEINFKYRWTPLSFEITPEGDIFMTNYLARKNEDPNSKEEKFSGSFELKKTKLNKFFSFVWLKDLLTPWKVDIKALLKEENPLDSLTKNIQTQIESKISKNNSLWNKVLMKSETEYEIQRQVLAHNFLSLYRPPVDSDYLEWKQGEITEENRGLFNLLNKFDKTIRMNPQAEWVLSSFFSNEKVKDFLRNIEYTEFNWKKMTTANFFSLLDKVSLNSNRENKNRITATFDLDILKKFSDTVSKISNKEDLKLYKKELPQIPLYTWTFEDGRLRLVNKEAVERKNAEIQQINC